MHAQPILVDVAGVRVQDVVDLVVGQVDADVDDELLHVIDSIISLKGQSSQPLHEQSFDKCPAKHIKQVNYVIQ